MKRTVGIDARMWVHAGIGRYVQELSRALLRITPPDRLVFFGDSKLLRPALGADATIFGAASPIYGAAEQLEMARLSRRVDVFHVPHFNAPFFGKRPFAATVHDLIHLRQPGSMKNPLGRLYVKMLLRNVADRAGAILTVSEATKQDLLNLFPRLDAARVTVAYEAASDYFRPLPAGSERSAVLSRFGLNKPFVLYVGSLKPHKNVTLLVQAMKKLAGEGKADGEAVIVGRLDPKFPEILAEIRSAPDGVRYLGEVPDDALVHLYNAASALVLPSWNEGFGLPALEAMACGTPVLLSRRASLPEIAGEAGLYFEPDRVDGLRELLYTIFKNQDLRQKMSQTCLARAARFTWERTARQTLAVYDAL